MAKVFPIKVVWRNTDGKTRTRGFDILPRAQKLQAALNSEGIASAIWVQDMLFDGSPDIGSKAYSQGEDIGF